MTEINYAAARGDHLTILAEISAGVDVNHQNKLESAFDILGDLDIEGLFEGMEGLTPELIERMKKTFRKDEDVSIEKTPLIFAAGDRRASVKILELLLSKGANINAAGGEVQKTALSAAIGLGCLKKVKFLVEQGAELDYSHHGYGLWLNIAYSCGCCNKQGNALVDYFINRHADFDRVSDHGEIAAAIFSKWGKFGLLKKIIDKGASMRCLGWNELMLNIVYGSLDDVKLSLAKVPYSPNEQDSSGRSAWLLAASVGDVKKAKLLLAAGAKFDEMDQDGRNAISMAARCEQAPMMVWLLSKGMSPNTVDKWHDTALHDAASFNSVKCIELLLKAGADPRKKTKNSDPALLNATSIEAIHAFIKAGADINVVGSDGYSLLKSAAEVNNLKLIQYLIAKGANLEVTSTGDTALSMAFVHDYLDIAETLLAAGANSNVLDCDNESVLHRSKSKKAIDLALRHGVDTNVVNCVGQTAMETLEEPLATYLKKAISSRTSDPK